MDWSLLIRFVDGETAAPAHLTRNEWRTEADLGAELLLLDDAPHPTASLVGDGFAARLGTGRPVAAAPAPHVTSELAAWRADPGWSERRIGRRKPGDLICGVAHLIAALRNDSAFLRDAAAVVVRNSRWMSIDACLAALGGEGRRALSPAQRAALWTRALQDRPSALGSVWSAPTAAQQASAAHRAAAEDRLTAVLIGRIGPPLGTRPPPRCGISLSTRRRGPRSSWDGMSDAERARP